MRELLDGAFVSFQTKVTGVKNFLCLKRKEKKRKVTDPRKAYYLLLLYDLAFSSANNDQNECNYESVLHSSGTGLTGFHQLTVSPKVCVFFVQTNN